ncbi:16S rRNA (uracil(1498)-N(3))-methyltransferase [Trichloromonas sp.]|uniref:16S rRNA (uracil(1498)-N(3))-methyltransferase n=1 Tax=Trichloromonas sp. TaxID=3069249 RepID=UPI003D817FD3
MHRFFLHPEAFGDNETILPDDVVHHLKTVLRLAVGDELLLLDGLGSLYHCRLKTLGKHAATALILKCWSEQETALPVQLIQSLPKGDKMDLVLQKGTELGITSFSPVVSERGIPQPSDDRRSKRHQRWQKIIQEASRQSRRPVLPRLDEVQPLVRVLTDCNANLRLMLWEEECLPLSAALPEAPPSSVAILVGPEGGFSDKEAALARQHNFQPVRIGPRILRSETAGFAVASILQYTYGDLGYREP